MQQETYVKFYRKALDNPMRVNDPTAWKVFTDLLLRVNYKNGKWTTDRTQLAELTGFKPTTAYQALQRLKKAKMVDTSSDNKKTVVRICKWSSYQQGDDSSNDISLTTTDSTTGLAKKYKEIKKKEIYKEKTERPKSELYEKWKNLPQPRPKYIEWIKRIKLKEMK